MAAAARDGRPPRRVPPYVGGLFVKSPLQPLYTAMEILSGLALIGMVGIIVTDVSLRVFGGQVPAADDVSGYGLVAVLFLGLAPAYRRGEHIRVGLMVDRLTGRVRHGLEVLLLALGFTAVAWATFWCGRLVWDSWRFHDVAQGLIAIPLWIPQLAMPLGLGTFAIALLEDLIGMLRGATPSYLVHAAASAEDALTFER